MNYLKITKQNNETKNPVNATISNQPFNQLPF